MSGLLLFSALLGLSAPAQAVDVYVNGVRADGLENIELEDVDVRIGPNGDIWIDAPEYRVEVDGEPAPPPPEKQAEVSGGAWWLVTEDNGSRGLVIDIVINGQAVTRLESGKSQTILDVGPWLQPGANTVVVNARQGRGASGGLFYVYLGAGSNQSGTLVMDKPDITFTRRAEEPGSTEAERSSRTFQLMVP